MILKNYINYEKDINNSLVSIHTYEVFQEDSSEYTFYFKNKFYIFLNLGDIITTKVKGKTIFCPPKHAFFGYNKKLTLKDNINKNIKITVFEFKKPLKERLLKKIAERIERKYRLFFEQKSFIFNFILNVELTNMIEEIYKCNDGLSGGLMLFEYEVKLYYLIFLIIKNILCGDYKYIDHTATDDFCFLQTVRSVFERTMTIENALEKYHITRKMLDNYLKDSICEKYTDFLAEKSKCLKR